MRWAELRGIVAVALAIAGIAFAWSRIESHTGDREGVTASTTTSTTTTTEPPPTTLSQDDLNLLICERARSFVDELAELPSEGGPGPQSELALGFWRDVTDMASGSARAEFVAVVAYYEDYIETAGPFGYDTAKIILEGDKEKLQQLITRPAPGFEGSRGLIGFGCGVEVPTQPHMNAKAFEDLEDRLLDEDDE